MRLKSLLTESSLLQVLVTNQEARNLGAHELFLVAVLDGCLINTISYCCFKCLYLYIA